MNTDNPLPVWLVCLLGVLLGLLTVILLPWLFLVALQSWIIWTREPHAPEPIPQPEAAHCDGGAAADGWIDAWEENNVRSQ